MLRMHIIHQSNDCFPSLLKFSTDPIKSFYFEGDEELLRRPYLSIVGAREVLPWVEYWMEQELIAALRGFDIGVISGGARGVDQLAHLCALRLGLPTIAVLPSGLNNKYPHYVEKLFGQNPNVGYISEYEPDEPMRKHYFYKRNRIIAALSPLTLVVQASEKSGTMITANYSMGLGRSIATLPASPIDNLCSGNLKLLYDGASLVRNSDDLKALLSLTFASQKWAKSV